MLDTWEKGTPVWVSPSLGGEPYEARIVAEVLSCVTVNRDGAPTANVHVVRKGSCFTTKEDACKDGIRRADEEYLCAEAADRTNRQEVAEQLATADYALAGAVMRRDWLHDFYARSLTA